MSLFHVFFDAYPPDIKANKLEYNKTINYKNNKLQEYLEKLKNKEISPEDYYSFTYNLIEETNIKVKNLSKEKIRINREFSFRGRKSFHFWIFVFGLVTALLFFSCKSLYNDIVHGSTFKFQFLSLTGIAISFFWMIHLIFLTQDDFTKNTYILMILSCAILATLFTYFLVKYYTYKDDIILKQLSLIDKIKTIHYPRVALKALYAERNDKAMLATDTVKENADAFDNDILTMLKDV
ncbi:hypothetical protein ACQY1Q_04245 [Tenacibaculum sp. TC6]|uniref:hypothetical protein n=1 Tax=Tenacibaculum sp. TC6 TaxID=3423223 RepID=UPI003D36948E